MFANHKIAAAVASALLAWAGCGGAQTPPPAGDDLQSVFRDALRNDATYAAARFTQQAAREREPQARAALLPGASGTVAYSRTHFASGTPDFSRETSTWGPALQLNAPIYRAQNWEAYSQAKLVVQQSEAQLALARQDLILRVTQAYFDILAAQDNLIAIEANKRAVAEQLAQARREFEVGTKTIVDTHEAQARFDQISAQEQVARGDLVVKQGALRAVIGRDPGPLLPLREEPRLAPPQPADMTNWVKQAEDGSFAVAVARVGTEIAKRETVRNRQGHYPTLDLVGSLRQDNNSASNFVSNRAVIAVPASNNFTANVGVQLTVPIYSGGLIQSRVREALANEEKAKQDLESARRNAAQSARQAYTGVDFGLAQVHALESAEVSAKSQLESTRLGYRVGVRINLDVLNAQTQLFNTQRDLKKSRYDFLLNGLRLQSAAGALEDKDVDTVNALLAR